MAVLLGAREVAGRARVDMLLIPLLLLSLLSLLLLLLLLLLMLLFSSSFPASAVTRRGWCLRSHCSQVLRRWPHFG